MKNKFYVYYDEKFSNYINNEVCYTTGVEYNMVMTAIDEEIENKMFLKDFSRESMDFLNSLEDQLNEVDVYGYGSIIITQKSIEESKYICKNNEMIEDKNIKDIVWGLRDDYNMYYYAWKDDETKECKNEEDGDDDDWYVIVTANRQEIEEDKLPGPFLLDHEGFEDLDDEKFGSTEGYLTCTKTPLDKIKKIAEERGYIEDKRIRDIGWG